MDKTRKLRATYAAIGALSGGLLACLVAALVRPSELGLMLAGLYVPFATGIGAALGLFINGNVKVHQAGGEQK